MDQLRRRLPHVWAEGKRLFVTWHLYGSLPHALYPPPNKQNAGQAFVWMDRYLDSARGGPLYLKQPPIAQLVVDSIHYAGVSTFSSCGSSADDLLFRDFDPEFFQEFGMFDYFLAQQSDQIQA